MTDAKKAAESGDTDGRASAGDKKGSTAARTEKPARSRDTGKKLVAGANALRERVASVVWLVAVVCALFLAVGALLVALKANPDNSIVSFVKNGADTLDLGVFSRENGIFTPKKDPDGVKSALINWGIGAVAYLVVGKVLDRIIRP